MRIEPAFLLQRFGLGVRGPDAQALLADPIGALRAEVSRREVAVPTGLDLVDTGAALRQLDEFRTARKIERERMAAQAATPSMAGPDNGKPTGDGPGMMAATSPPAGTPGAKPPEPVPQKLFRAEALARLLAATGARAGFAERLVWFWANHFAVSVAKGPAVRVGAGPFEREAIRPHVFGTFEAMLLAVESHPVMLFYLDNRQSIGPNSRAGERRNKGLNENLARETLELHTLGVGAGYTQADVTALARIITGWTVIGPQDEDAEMGAFHFNPNRHEPGPQTLLGKTYPDTGFTQGVAALRDLAHHPATASHLAAKLARHFVADEPPPALVQRLASVFRRTGGDLAAVSLALLEAPEALESAPAKLRSPQEFMVGALRALSIDPVDARPVLGSLIALGQPMWQPGGPNGYGDTLAQWGTPEGMKARLDLALAISRRAPKDLNPSDLAAGLYREALSAETRQAIARAETKQQGLALLFMSPEFQRR